MDDNNNEKELFDLMDNLEEESVINTLDNMDLIEDIRVPEKAMKNIKTKAYEKTGLKPLKRAGGLFSWRSVAAVACSLVLILLITNINTVLAEVKKVLFYIPGINQVIKSEEQTGVIYTLAKPVTAKIGEGTVTVKGVSIDGKGALIVLQGKNTAKLREVDFFDASGQKYSTNSHMVSSGNNEWYGSYWYEGPVEETDQINIVVKDQKETIIPLELKEAGSYDSYEQMGPTDVKNNVSVTAVTSSEEEKLRVNLVSPPEDGVRIVSYGDYGDNVSLSDDAGKQYKRWKPDTSFLSGDEIYYDIEGRTEKAGDNNLILKIPYIVTEGYDEASRQCVDISVPKEGSIKLDKSVTFAGFPIAFKEMERLGEKSVRLYVDVGYNENDASSLRKFSIGNIANGSNHIKSEFKKQGMVSDEAVILSHMLKVSETTGAVEYFEFEIDSSADSITLLLSRPEIVVRGPWMFSITLE